MFVRVNDECRHSPEVTWRNNPRWHSPKSKIERSDWKLRVVKPLALSLSIVPLLSPLGSSLPDCRNSLLLCHKEQHFKSNLQAFLPSLLLFLQCPVKVVERRASGGMAGQGFATSLGIQHSVKSRHTAGMAQEAVAGRWVWWGWKRGRKMKTGREWREERRDET